MLAELNDDERALKEGVEAFTEGSLRPGIKRHVDDHEFPTDLVREFLALGYMGTAYDLDHDGAGFEQNEVMDSDGSRYQNHYHH